VLSGIEALTIFADDDEAGINVARECGKRWAGAGHEAFIAELPIKDNYND
jgi:hypothetical protein